jgi:hypothetical protein
VRAANRHYGGMEGFQSITHTELGWWMRNRQIALTTWEQDVIFALDGVRFESLQEHFTYENEDAPAQLTLLERKPELRYVM